MIEGLLVFLLLLAPTVQYRMELGPFSVAFAEPIVLVVAGLLLLYQVGHQKRLVVIREPFLLFPVVITVWAFIVRPWAANWQNGLSDVRDWLIPLIPFILLLSSFQRRWRKWLFIFLIIIFLYALLGTYQYMTDGFRPFIAEFADKKTGFAISPEDDRLVFVSFAIGFFAHANQFAMLLFVGLMAGLGWQTETRYGRPLKWLFLAFVSVVLFWTYAKTSMLVTVLALCFWFLHRTIKSGRTLAVFMVMGTVLAIIIAMVLVPQIPSLFLGTFWWRVQLWQIAISVLAENPWIFLTGNGMDVFADQAFYNQPHNVYFYMLLQFGLVGFVWILALLGYAWQRGWQWRKAGLMQREPLLGALWITLLGYFLIGMVESNLMGIESRMIFLWVLAFFLGLGRELSSNRHGNPDKSSETQGQKETSEGLSYSQ